jgi:hypothetical protein
MRCVPYRRGGRVLVSLGWIYNWLSFIHDNTVMGKMEQLPTLTNVHKLNTNTHHHPSFQQVLPSKAKALFLRV